MRFTRGITEITITYILGEINQEFAFASRLRFTPSVVTPKLVSGNIKSSCRVGHGVSIFLEPSSKTYALSHEAIHLGHGFRTLRKKSACDRVVLCCTILRGLKQSQ